MNPRDRPPLLYIRGQGRSGRYGTSKVVDPMPIRFRCKYCNQLMGIAHRKAGTEVECPTCKGKVAVPLSSSEMAAAPPSPPAVNAPLFEQSDFGDFLNVPQKD